eukprot:3959036-Pleurochrysis_carterae.AAC.1
MLQGGNSLPFKGKQLILNASGTQVVVTDAHNVSTAELEREIWKAHKLPIQDARLIQPYSDLKNSFKLCKCGRSKISMGT